MASSSRARSSSPFSHRKPSTPHSSLLIIIHFFCHQRTRNASFLFFFHSSFYNSGGGGGPSMTPSRGRSDSIGYGYGNPSPVEFGMEDEICSLKKSTIEETRSRDGVFGPHTNSDEVYEVAAKPVVKSAMDGVNE
ncbi:hypothetical protein V8G54_013950 [Vigna mungo]|uniref:Uncharacterized protein n=1 Tax=Vigna mungo TaxID=3915 RepID=A0AAQ3NFQ6_VIGMU